MMKKGDRGDNIEEEGCFALEAIIEDRIEGKGLFHRIDNRNEKFRGRKM